MSQKQIIFLIDSTLDSNIRAFKTIRSLSKNYNLIIFHRGKLKSDSNFREIENTNFFEVSYSIESFFNRTYFLGNDFIANFNIEVGKSFLNNLFAVYCVDLWTLPAGEKLAKTHNIKLIYDSYEICSETLSQHYPIQGFSPKSLFFRSWITITKMIAKKYESNLFPKVDLFITTNQSYLNFFHSHYKIKKSVTVMNCPNFISQIKKIDLHKKYKIPDAEFILLYIGWFNNGRKLEEIIRSTKYLDKNCHLLFIGQGPLYFNLEKLALNHDNVTVGGAFNMDETNSLISGADAGILLLDKNNISKFFASANKVFDFMLSGKPMLLSNSPENKKISEKSMHFKLVNYENEIKLALDINKFVKEIKNSDSNLISSDLKRMSQEEFNWEKQEKKLLSYIDNL